MAKGILTGITGNRVDGVIWDDLIKGREQADSDVVRNKTWDAYFDDLMTRKKPHAWEVAINTRWHEDDPAGRILPPDYDGQTGLIKCQDGNDWYVVNLPAECEREDDILGRKIGDILWPEWFTKEMFAPFKRNPRTWSSLYQQRPAPREGNQFKIGMWGWCALAGDGTPLGRPDKARNTPAVVIPRRKDGSLDLEWLCLSIDASNGATGPDASALGLGILGGQAGGLRRFVLEDLTDGPATWLQTMRRCASGIVRAAEIAGKQRRFTVLLEKKAMGASEDAPLPTQLRNALARGVIEVGGVQVSALRGGRLSRWRSRQRQCMPRISIWHRTFRNQEHGADLISLAKRNKESVIPTSSRTKAPQSDLHVESGA
jgi:hypothetical protein